MTKAQRYTLLIDNPKRNHTSMWTRACQANQWDHKDREFRLHKISEAIGREISSTSDLVDNNEITRLFTWLRAKADNLAAGVAMQTPGFERRPQLLYKIEEAESELTAWPASDPMGVNGVRALVQKLCADIGNKGRSRRVEITDVEDLSAAPIEFTRNGTRRRIPSQLDQLLVTLTRMLSKYKKEAEAEASFLRNAGAIVADNPNWNDNQPF